MASTSSKESSEMQDHVVEDAKKLVWGCDIKSEVFRRWTQGFEFSEDEPTALVQHEGGPCAVMAPIQGYLLKNLLFNPEHCKDNWRDISEEERDDLLAKALLDVFIAVASRETFTVVVHRPSVDPDAQDLDCEGMANNGETNPEDGQSSPKKRRFSHEQFHEGLRCHECSSQQELHERLKEVSPAYQRKYGVLLTLYSVILTKGIDQIKNEVEDPSEALIDGMHGHGSQSLINLLLTGTAVTNVWDNDKDVSGLTLRGIGQKATIGFLTLLEHMRYCEVGWYMKNPEYAIWVLGSETHLTVLFSVEQSLVSQETPEAQARRIFNQFDTEGSGFISAAVVGDLLHALDLVSDPEYVKIMVEKMDPEQLGIVTLNSFMETFFPSHNGPEVIQAFSLFHYNGLKHSCPSNKVAYQECSAVILDHQETQMISDTSPIKTCLMTKWPTIEVQWKNNIIPSLN